MRTHYLLLPFILIFLSNLSYGQYTDTVVQYLDKKWEKIDPEKEDYYYFRIAKKTTEGTWHVKDFYRDTKQPQSEGICIDDSMKIYDGKVYYYHYNGSLQMECSYYRGTPVGLLRKYNIYGKLTDSMRYKSTGMPFHKAFSWDYDGNLIFFGDYDIKGSGAGYETVYNSDSTISQFGKYTTGHMRDSIWSYFRQDGSLSVTETYDSGKLIDYTCYDKNSIAMTYKCDTACMMPVPAYDVYRYLGENIHMPVEAMNMGLVGRYWVNIKFSIGIDGSIIDPHVDYGSYDFFNYEALRVVMKMPNWRPGVAKNRKVKVYYTLPVNFKL